MRSNTDGWSNQQLNDRIQMLEGKLEATQKNCVWVPRGYYSTSKIKDDDVKMYILDCSEFTTKGEEEEKIDG